MKISYLKDYLARAVGLAPVQEAESETTWITAPNGDVWYLDADLLRVGLVTKGSGGVHKVEDWKDWEELGA